MTRRIALAILLSVWTLLITGGVGAYWLTRSAMLQLLDESLFAYASSVPGLIHGSAAQPSLNPLGQDRYRVVDNLQRTVGQPPPTAAQWQPKLLSATFSYAQGQHDRTVTLQAYSAVTETQPVPRPVTVVYTASAAEFDAKMRRLAVAYILSGLAVGLLTAAVAVKVSKSTLKPLAATNRQIASIDEQHLDRRIDVAALPSELVPMAERLNELLARLQAAFLQRNRFLADASHELRTPVAALVTRLQVAARHPRSTDFYRQVVVECSHEADQLRHLIEQLMQQVRSQNLVYNEAAEELDLAALLQQCSQTVSALAEAKGLTMKGPTLPPMWCLLPPQRMRSVVLNLLSNAIEYSRPGGTIELDCKHEHGHVQIDITDNGVGIAPEHLPHIFEPFYRTDAARIHETGHLGLGLSLVRSHLQAIGGTCQVTSALGAGSTFSIKIPEKALKIREAALHLESAPAG
jgi:signal transduction histidine kinase